MVLVPTIFSSPQAPSTVTMKLSPFWCFSSISLPTSSSGSFKSSFVSPESSISDTKPSSISINYEIKEIPLSTLWKLLLKGILFLLKKFCNILYFWRRFSRIPSALLIRHKLDRCRNHKQLDLSYTILHAFYI